jgi:hypothetical protein
MPADAGPQGSRTRRAEVDSYAFDEEEETGHMWQEGPGEGSNEHQMPLFVLDHDEVCVYVFMEIFCGLLSSGSSFAHSNSRYLTSLPTQVLA